MKKILMLATGGTIACLPAPDGLVPALDGESMCQMVPELKNICEITCQEILNLDSSNLSPRHWQLMAQAIEKKLCFLRRLRYYPRHRYNGL